MSRTSVFAEPLTAAMRHALEHLDGLEERGVDATATLEEVRRRIDVPLEAKGMEPVRVVEELVSASKDAIVASAGPRFFGFVIGGSLPAALAADWLTSAWDQNAGLYVIGPAAAVVEEVAGGWLKSMFGLPEAASFALVTGCQMAHVTCLAAARHAVLERAGWDVEKDGLTGAPAVRILTSTEQHATVPRAARLLGLGTASIEALECDDEGRLRVDALAGALKKDGKRPTGGNPKIVVLQAGDLNRGAFDEFQRLIPLAHEHGAWVHVDGAMGLWCAASPKYRWLLEGASEADSWSTDGHKWLNVPYDCGYAFVRDAAAHYAAFGVHSAYLVQGAGARDQVDWTPEFSRRARGFATYAALRQLGREGVAEMVERCCAMARALIERIGALPGAKALCEPLINQGMVRFHDPTPGATEADHDRFTDEVMTGIRSSGEAFFTGTTWKGVRAMRVSVSNWQTSMEDVERTVECVARVVETAHVKRGQPR
ncbi:MAG TPA: aminotransferase class V-fold PLP-dependent enzyme [Acidobacteriaceae bacterium]|jgi:aromatic-L-amino-acid decarboxylase|nr:aminotransferase class V-fold PLP-dependent enzyme [Acidobacteriaceae bacterium]